MSFYMKKNCNAEEAINLLRGACSAASKGHRPVRWKRQKSLLLFCNANGRSWLFSTFAATQQFGSD